MAWTLIASAKETSGGGGPTDAIDTTGANLFILSITGSITPTENNQDSAGNTWTPLTTRSGGGNGVQRLFYCYNPTTSATHTFYPNTTSPDPVAGVCVLAFSGSAASPFDQESGSVNASATSGQPGSLTPSEDGCLIVTGIGHGAAEAFSSINSGFTLQQNKAGVGGTVYSCGLAYLAQGTAAAVNPTWSWATSAGSEIAMAVFKGTGGGASAEGGGMLLGSRRNRLTIP